MLDSSAIKGVLSKTLELTRTHKVRKQSSTGEKDEFFKEVRDKIGDRESSGRGKDHYRPDEVDLQEAEEDKDQQSNHVLPENKANKDLPGVVGKSVDIKI